MKVWTAILHYVQLYLNGEFEERRNSFSYNESLSVRTLFRLLKPMTAFGRYMRVSDDLYEEGFSGYMKKIRIWKSAKDNEYVQNSYNGTAEVTGKEADLAAAWDFMTKPSGSGNEVIDLTGRHTAKIIGTYEWQRIVE